MVSGRSSDSDLIDNMLTGQDRCTNDALQTLPGNEVDPVPQKCGQFFLNVDECKQSHLGIRLEFHQHVHVTLRPKIITQDRAKPR